jgi:hypothetical protein
MKFLFWITEIWRNLVDITQECNVDYASQIASNVKGKIHSSLKEQRRFIRLLYPTI